MDLKGLLNKQNKSKEDLQVSSIIRKNIYNFLKKTKIGKNFFKMMSGIQKDTSTVLEICGCFYYEFSPAGRVIFREGDTENTNFYFVMEGSVGVYISSLLKNPKKKELNELENPMWNYLATKDKEMESIYRKLREYRFPKEDISVYLPKCKLK